MADLLRPGDHGLVGGGIGPDGKPDARVAKLPPPTPAPTGVVLLNPYQGGGGGGGTVGPPGAGSGGGWMTAGDYDGLEGGPFGPLPVSGLVSGLPSTARRPRRGAAHGPLAFGSLGVDGSGGGAVEAYIDPRLVREEPKEPWWWKLYDDIYEKTYESWAVQTSLKGDSPRTRRSWWGDWAGLNPSLVGHGVKLYWLGLVAHWLHELARVTGKTVGDGPPEDLLNLFVDCSLTIKKFLSEIHIHYTGDLMLLRVMKKISSEEADEDSSKVTEITEKMASLEDEARKRAKNEAAGVGPKSVYGGK